MLTIREAVCSFVILAVLAAGDAVPGASCRHRLDLDIVPSRVDVVVERRDPRSTGPEVPALSTTTNWNQKNVVDSIHALSGCQQSTLTYTGKQHLSDLLHKLR